MKVFNATKKVTKYLGLSLVIIFAVDALLVSPFLRPFGGSSGDDGFQKGIIRAQRYAYDLKSPKVVVVGTSLSEGLYSHLIANQVYNLAIAQFASHTGLEIIKRKKEKPKLILIEGNFLQIGSTNQTYVDIIYDPVFYPLAEIFRGLRIEYRPKQIAKYLIRMATRTESLSITPGIPQRVDLRTGLLPPVDPTQLEDLQRTAADPLPVRSAEEEERLNALRRAVPGYPIFKRIEDSPDNIFVIKKYMDELVKDGCRFVFYFVPQPRGLMVTANLHTAIDTMKRFFPDIPVIYDPDESRYLLADTYHLEGIGMARFVLFLRDKMEELYGPDLASLSDK